MRVFGPRCAGPKPDSGPPGEAWAYVKDCVVEGSPVEERMFNAAWRLIELGTHGQG